jgi:hypothetical protein
MVDLQRSCYYERFSSLISAKRDSMADFERDLTLQREPYVKNRSLSASEPLRISGSSANSDLSQTVRQLSSYI